MMRGPLLLVLLTAAPGRPPLRAVLLAVLFTLLRAPLSAQVTVETGKRLLIPEPGATAAVSLNTQVATAAIVNHVLTIVAVDPGDVRVVALYPTNIAEVRVHVVQAPPVYPPGFIEPQVRDRGSGSYEARYSSDRMQFENAVDLFTQGLLGSSQLHVVSATLPEAAQPSTTVPSAYYRVTTPHVDFAVLDQAVDTSPLTLQNAVLRGFHLREGRWQFHGGYTTSADFADVLVPVQKEFAAGVGYTRPLGRYLKLVPQAYVLRSIDMEDGRQRSALIASVVTKVHFPQDWRLQTEVAVGRGSGFAASLEHASATSTFRAAVTEKSLRYPSLRSSTLPGLAGELAWSQLFTKRLGLVSGATVDHIQLKALQQDSSGASATLRYRFFRSLSVGTGASYTSFRSPGSYSSRTLTLPQQIDFTRAHFGGGLQYQLATASHSFSNGSGLRQNFRVDAKRFQIGEFADWQTDAVGIHSLEAQLPQVESNLQRRAILAASPEDVSALMRSAAYLHALSAVSSATVPSARLEAVPRRVEEGGSLTWSSTGAHPHQVGVSAFASHSRYAGAKTDDYSVAGSYIKEIGASNQIQLSATVVHSSLGHSSLGQSGLGGARQVAPAVSVSFRHTFSRSPAVLAVDKDYAIGGTVFVDTKAHGWYEDGMEGIAQVRVVLDGKRAVLTDSTGGYYFGGLSSGDHRVEIVYKSEREHYSTTPQETTVEAGSTVNFGIHFPTADLWGYVEDDAGEGLEGILLVIAGPAGKAVAATGRSGKFLLADVPPGTYRIEADAESVPLGYLTDDLGPVEVAIAASASSHPVLKITAIRVLTGTVTHYDPAVGRYVPVPGAVVGLPALGRSVSTNGAGRFTLSGLPPGEVEVRVTAGRSSSTHTVQMPVQPCALREDDKVSALDGTITTTRGTVTLEGGRKLN